MVSRFFRRALCCTSSDSTPTLNQDYDYQTSALDVLNDDGRYTDRRENPPRVERRIRAADTPSGYANHNFGTIEGSQNIVSGPYYDNSYADRRSSHQEVNAPGHTSYSITYQVNNPAVFSVANHGATTDGATRGPRSEFMDTPGLQRGRNEPGLNIVGTLSLRDILKGFFAFFIGGQGNDPLKTESPAVEGHSTSPESEEKDSEVLQIDDPTQLPANSSSRPPSEVYVRTLLTQGHGLPCWEPKPFYPQAQPQGVVPGDVGIYTMEGGLKRTFNLFESQDVIHQIARTHCQMTTYQSLRGDAHTRAGCMQSGEAIAGGASTTTVVRRLPGVPTRDVLYEFRCHSSFGAILATPTSADKVEVDDLVGMERYIRVHAEAIYRHAHSIRPIGENESLYIVTGCVKSNSWALAAYEGEMPPQDQTLQLISEAPSPGSEETMPRYRWTQQGTSRTRWGIGDSELVKDQSLFLLGFKVAFSYQFRARVEGGVCVNEEAGTKSIEDGAVDDTRNTTPRVDRASSSGGNSEVGSSGKGSEGQSLQSGPNHNPLTAKLRAAIEGAEGPSENCNFEWKSFPESPQTPYHPSDVINKYIMQQTGCGVAICHDDSWRTFLKMGPSADLATLQHDAGDCDICIQDGVAFILLAKPGKGVDGPQGAIGVSDERAFNQHLSGCDSDETSDAAGPDSSNQHDDIQHLQMRHDKGLRANQAPDIPVIYAGYGAPPAYSGDSHHVVINWAEDETPGSSSHQQPPRAEDSLTPGTLSTRSTLQVPTTIHNSEHYLGTPPPSSGSSPRSTTKLPDFNCDSQAGSTQRYTCPPVTTPSDGSEIFSFNITASPERQRGHDYPSPPGSRRGSHLSSSERGGPE